MTRIFFILLLILTHQTAAAEFSTPFTHTDLNLNLPLIDSEPGWLQTRNGSWPSVGDNAPPLPNSRVSLQILSGSLTGLAGMVVGLGAGFKLSNCGGGDPLPCGLLLAGVLGLGGWSLGTTAGVYFSGQETGIMASPLKTLGGVILGQLSLVVISPFAAVLGPAGLIVVYTIPAMMGALMFNSSRIYTEVPLQTAQDPSSGQRVASLPVFSLRF